MSGSKPLASLTPTLLARKGGARPAMRSQLNALRVDPLLSEEADDLGWNDMGSEDPVSGDVVSLVQDAPILVSAVPEVVRQQRTIARRVSAERRSALSDGKRAAFTLRVDAERHLKLRLACTLNGRSAQQLVTDALDRLLADLPDVAALAAMAKTPRNS